ncbi:hypothetical protein P872_10430 [Rhodonellum psychrophilum GCM71 = DSM 17998]|uniref:Uncharacterized protein n=1 Tax=Rhodonellum psychrophilum GCM71 = DSM 17998 TaxID=1123057 RepID=U5BZS7_9BACT|nr:hypothetical protein P872_10430 [Rhodonellum psychrophilum GCM71 = DSM 17998]
MVFGMVNFSSSMETKKNHRSIRWFFLNQKMV